MTQKFTSRDLRSVRASAGRLAAGWASDEVTEEFVLAVSEIATNAILHGGGSGVVSLWRTDDELSCRISDDGPGMRDPTAGTTPPPPSTKGGYGLWLVRSLCSRVLIDTSWRGTTVLLQTVRSPLSPPGHPVLP